VPAARARVQAGIPRVPVPPGAAYTGTWTHREKLQFFLQYTALLAHSFREFSNNKWFHFIVLVLHSRGRQKVVFRGVFEFVGL